MTNVLWQKYFEGFHPFLILLHRNIELKTPYKVNDESREIHHTYLDTVGRPVVVAKGYNLVEQHIQDFEV